MRLQCPLGGNPALVQSACCLSVAPSIFLDMISVALPVALTAALLHLCREGLLLRLACCTSPLAPRCDLNCLAGCSLSGDPALGLCCICHLLCLWPSPRQYRGCSNLTMPVPLYAVIQCTQVALSVAMECSMRFSLLGFLAGLRCNLVCYACCNLWGNAVLVRQCDYWLCTLLFLWQFSACSTTRCHSLCDFSRHACISLDLPLALLAGWPSSGWIQVNLALNGVFPIQVQISLP